MSDGTRDLLLALDRTGAEPLRHQLETSLRDAIRAGRLRPGVRLPSSRDLARSLAVSRGVVVDAYGALAAQGFLDVRPRAAPVVASLPATPAGVQEEPEHPSARFDFTATTPDVSLFARREWLSAHEHVLRTAPDAALAYGDPRGQGALRAALADHLGRVRGVVAPPSRIVVTQAFSQALDVALRVLAAHGARRIAFEDPSLDDQWETARRAGLEPVAVPVDAGGIRTDRLPDAAAVVVTPAHQFPTGVVLDPARRRELLAWAADCGALVIEDDYDAEFRYDRAPVGTLQGLDPAHVLYVGTTSKTLAPALRLGWAVVPPGLVDEFAHAKWYSDSGSPAVGQLALAHLLGSGAYERQVRRARTAYRARRDALLAALERELPGWRAEGIAAGLHIVLRLPAGMDEHVAGAAATAARLKVRTLGSFRLASLPAHEPSLVLGYGRLPEPAVAPAVRALAETLRAL